MVKAFFVCILCAFTNPFARAASFLPPDGYVWDSTKKFLAPKVMPVISAEEMEPWYQARDNAILFIENTLKNESSKLSVEEQNILRNTVLGLKTIDFEVWNPMTIDQQRNEDFFAKSKKFDTYSCDETDLGAYTG
ncbi:MAG: hypothetical protein AAGB31_16720, partial [Bdellovibrio sp.]